MAQLSKILGSILRDMVSAQHKANMYALKLSNTYRNQNQATTLRPPAVYLGEVELILHCGFTGESVSGEDYEIDHTAVLRTIKELSSQLSEVIVSGILSTITQNAAHENKEEGPIARLNREKKVRQNFITYLGRKLTLHLQRHRAEFIAPDGSIDADTLLENILFISDGEFLSHSDLEDLFSSDTTGQLRSKVQINLNTDIKMILPRLLKEVNLKRQSKYSSMEVIVSSEELSKLPDECIQTFRLKISSRDLPSETEEE
ncbi:hypothetical protein [uncultured Odoribacter sp.]|uniref:hypothetical protein n=1 Tax=uncultured Odoribacter sp. TaxID=876416 RepID=UPI00260ED685|nr:hypothetical protein [uncultured Odoribacter sp.]